MLLAMEEDNNSSNNCRMLQRQQFSVPEPAPVSVSGPQTALGGGFQGGPFTERAGQGGEGLRLGLQVAVEELEIEHQAACLTHLTFCTLPGRVLLPLWGGPFSAFLQ